MGLEVINGCQGGDLNAHWERWHPSLGLGSCDGLVYSHPWCLCFAPVQCNEVRLQWHKQVCGWSGFNGIIFLFRLDIYTYFSSWLCSVAILWGLVRIVGCSCGKALGKSIPYLGKPDVQVFNLFPHCFMVKTMLFLALGLNYLALVSNGCVWDGIWL